MALTIGHLTLGQPITVKCNPVTTDSAVTGYNKLVTGREGLIEVHAECIDLRPHMFTQCDHIDSISVHRIREITAVFTTVF